MYVPNEDLAQIARQPLMLMSYQNPLAKCNVVDELEAEHNGDGEK